MRNATPVQLPDRLWTVDFALTLLTAHFLFASFASLFTVVPPYVLDRGGQEWQIGVVVGSFGAVSLTVRPFAGRWVYRLGSRRVAFAGCAVFAASSLLYIPASSVWLLIPVRMLQGVGMAMGPVATSTMVANLAPVSRRAEAMAYMGSAVAVSNLYAPLIGFWLIAHFGFPASFVFSAVCGLLGAVLALRMSAARAGIPAGGPTAETVPLINKSALFPTAVLLSYSLTTAPITTFLPLLAEERNLGNPGLYFTVSALTSMFSLSLSGPVADRVGRSTVIIPGLLLGAAAMFLLVTASSQPMLLLAAFLSGAGFGLLQPGIQSLTLDRAAPRERSSAMATFQSAWDIGGFGGAFVLGPIAGALGVAAPFGIAGVATLAGAAGFVVGNARAPAELPPKKDAPPEGRGRK